MSALDIEGINRIRIAAGETPLIIVEGKEDTPRVASFQRVREVLATIAERSTEPLVTLRIGDGSIATVRLGSFVALTAPTGAGKSSLAGNIVLSHLKSGGIVIVLSRELNADEFIARLVGIELGRSWLEVLTGHVLPNDMSRAVDYPRLAILERRAATLANLRIAIEAMRVEFGDASILVVADYLQIIESNEREIRARVSDVVSQLDELAREHRVVVLAISQMSRAAARAAKSGEMTGADSTDGGAESAAIERASTVTLQLGASGSEREDGTRVIELSIGKGRMMAADRVQPVAYCGRTGRFRIEGDAKPAAEARAERDNERDAARVSAAALAMIAAAAKAKAPLTQEELRQAAAVKRDIARKARDKAIADGDLVEVMQKAKRATCWKVWTPDRAADAGIPLAEGPL